jgi:hypothetical protein
MQRVRMRLPHFAEFGWEPCVLAVAATGDETLDPLLLETVPSDIKVERVRAIPAAISKQVGIGNVALRALPFLYHAIGSRFISGQQFRQPIVGQSVYCACAATSFRRSRSA